MKKRLGIAAAGAALAASVVGGAAFAASPGSHEVKCANFDTRVNVLAGNVTVAAFEGNTARQARLTNKLNALLAKKTAAGC
jgi:hypothetical protein